MGMEKTKAKIGPAARLLATGIVSPWWRVVKIPNWLKSIGIRWEWFEIRHSSVPRGAVSIRLTPKGMAVRDQAIIEYAEMAEKERKEKARRK